MPDNYFDDAASAAIDELAAELGVTLRSAIEEAGSEILRRAGGEVRELTGQIDTATDKVGRSLLSMGDEIEIRTAKALDHGVSAKVIPALVRESKRFVESAETQFGHHLRDVQQIVSTIDKSVFDSETRLGTVVKANGEKVAKVIGQAIDSRFSELVAEVTRTSDSRTSELSMGIAGLAKSAASSEARITQTTTTGLAELSKHGSLGTTQIKSALENLGTGFTEQLKGAKLETTRVFQRCETTEQTLRLAVDGLNERMKSTAKAAVAQLSDNHKTVTERFDAAGKDLALHVQGLSQEQQRANALITVVVEALKAQDLRLRRMWYTLIATAAAVSGILILIALGWH